MLSFLYSSTVTSIYMTTGKTIALTRWAFVGKVMSLFFNMLSRLVITFLPRSKHLLFHGCSQHLQWFWSPENKFCHCFPIYLPCSDGTRYHECWVFRMLSFKPVFSLSSFTFIKRLFSSSSLSCHKGGVICISEVIDRYFSRQSWFQLVLHPAQRFSWCTLHRS